MSLQWYPYMSAAGAPMERGTNEVGGASFLNLPTPASCLGGMRSELHLPMEKQIPEFMGAEYDHPDGVVLGSSNYRLFEDLTSTERAAGKTDYRALFFLYEGGTANFNLWIDQPKSGTGTINVWRPIPNASGYIERIDTETTAPTGAAFSNPTNMAPLVLGTFGTSPNPYHFPLWFRRVINAATPAYPYDYFKVTISDGTLSWQFVFYYTLRSTAASMSIVGAKDGSVITAPEGEVYTVTVKDASGTPVDPAGQRLHATFAQTNYLPRSLRANPNVYTRGTLTTGSFLVPGKRTGTGTFDLAFRPPHPGHFQAKFNAGGGEVIADRSIEVSAVGRA